MSFLGQITDPMPAPPGDLLWLACDVSTLAGKMLRLENGSPEWKACVGDLLRHRTALAHSIPETDLDLLMLAFTARQALWILRNAEHLGTDKARRQYWGDEAEAALVRMQFVLEHRCGTTMDDLSVPFLGGNMSDA